MNNSKSWRDVRKELLDDMSQWQRLKYHVSYWFLSKWWTFQLWLKSFEQCHKESLGYVCHHEILSNGKKECGGDE